jgi:hypothetical protein
MNWTRQKVPTPRLRGSLLPRSACHSSACCLINRLRQTRLFSHAHPFGAPLRLGSRASEGSGGTGRTGEKISGQSRTD